MALTIKNKPDATTYPIQAKAFQADIDAMVAGIGGRGIKNGCAVTAQGTPNNTVAVSSGYAVFDGLVAVTSGNVTMPASDATNPMLVSIVVADTGTKSAVAGTPAANPLMPDLASDEALLATIIWPANATEVEADMIVDKRAILPPERAFCVKFLATAYYTSWVIPAAVTEFAPNSSGENTREVADVTYATQVRIVTGRAGGSVSGAKLAVQFDNANVADWTYANGTDGPFLQSMVSYSEYDSGYVTLDSRAREENTIFRLVGLSGDGSTPLFITSIGVWFR